MSSRATPNPAPSPLRPAMDDDSGTFRFHVTFEVPDSIHRLEDVTRMQRTVIAVMERCASSRQVRDHGMFADMRGGYVIAEFGDIQELVELFAGLQDVARLRVHPVTSTESGLRFLRGLMATEALG